MTSDAEDALSWEGDDERPGAPRPPGPGRAGARRRGHRHGPADAASAEQMSSGMLLALGVFGGVFALYVVGWIIGGWNLRPLAALFLADAFVTPWIVLAAVGTALWLPTVWLLTRRHAGWIRIVLLLVGAVLLVPWPFVMLGAVGS